MNIRIKKDNMLNYCALALLTLTYYAYVCRRIFGFERYYITNLHSTCFRVVLLLGLLVVIIMKAYKQKKVLLASLAVIIFVLSLSIYKEKSSLTEWIMNFDVLAYVMAIIACKDINYRTIIKVLLFLYLILNSYSLVYSMIFRFRSELSIRDGDSLRYQLGRINGSEVSLIYYYIVLYYCYIRNSKIRFFEKVLLVLTLFVMYYLTNTRYPFILSLAFMLLVFNVKYIKKIVLSKYFSLLLALVIVVVPLFILYLCISFDANNQFYVTVNRLLSGRLELVGNAFYEFRIHLFSNEIVYSMVNYNIIDPSFFIILFEYGILFYIIFVLFLLYFLYLMYKNKDEYLLLVFAFSVFDMLVNTTISYFQYNLLLFVLSYKNSMLLDRNINDLKTTHIRFK